MVLLLLLLLEEEEEEEGEEEEEDEEEEELEWLKAKFSSPDRLVTLRCCCDLVDVWVLTGTKEGKVLMWSFRGEYAKGNQSETAASTGPQDWEPAPPTIVSS